MDLSLYRLTVVHTCFWEAILAMKKLVEFRSPRQLVQFIPGLRLLFSLNATERKKGRTDLIEAVVPEIDLLLGNQGVLRQIDDTNGIARFCRGNQPGTN